MSRNLLIIVAVLLVASQAYAVPRNTVKAHIDKATKAHKEGKFDVALDELKAAYGLDPKPDLLFAIAQVYVKLDKCTEAIEYYEKFLATVKDDGTKQVVAQAIDACKSKLGSTEPKPEPVVEPKPEPKPEPIVEPKPEPIVETKPEPPRNGNADDPFAAGRSTGTTYKPWYKDPLGDALVGGGVLVGVGALLFRNTAAGEADKAEKAATEDEYRDHRDKADSNEKLALVLGVSAGVLVTAGVVRYVTRDSGKKQETRVGVAPTRDGGLITVLGRF